MNYTPTHERMLLLGVFTVLIVIGLLGNIGVIFVIFKLNYMRNLTNFYLGNLAAADLCFITVMAVQYVWPQSKSPVKFDVPYRSSFGCIMSTFVTYLSVFTSFAFVTLVTVERYFAICKPLQFRRISGKNRSIKLILGTWLGCSLLAGPYFFWLPSLDATCIKWPNETTFISLPSKIYTCTSIYEWITPVVYYVQVIVFWPALFFNIILSVKIISALSQRNSLAKSNQQQTDIIRNQVARMLITNNVVFFLLHGPYHVMNVINISEEHLGYDLINSYASDVMFWVGQVSAVANSAVNPIIYNVTNPRYREAFAKCFWCDSKAGNSSHRKDTQPIRPSTTQGSAVEPQQAL